MSSSKLQSVVQDVFTPGVNVLKAGGGSLISPNGLFQLVMQGDGNVVVYTNDTAHQAVWSAQSYLQLTFPNDPTIQTAVGTIAKDYGKNLPYYLIMQDDSNLVVYSDYNNPGGTPFYSINDSTFDTDSPYFKLELLNSGMIQVSDAYVWTPIAPVKPS